MENTKINICPVVYGLDSDFFQSVTGSNKTLNAKLTLDFWFT